MIYSDAENERWWKGLTKGDQEELLETMHFKASTPGFRDFVQSVWDRWKANVTLSPKELAALRKWDKI